MWIVSQSYTAQVTHVKGTLGGSCLKVIWIITLIIILTIVIVSIFWRLSWRVWKKHKNLRYFTEHGIQPSPYLVIHKGSSTRSALAVWIIPTLSLFFCCILVYFLVVLCLDDYVNLTSMCQSFNWMLILLLFTLTLLSPHLDFRFTQIYIKLPIKCT